MRTQNCSCMIVNRDNKRQNVSDFKNHVYLWKKRTFDRENTTER